MPALPPQDYRAAEYQSTDGAKCVNSWFEGYPAGVAAARKDRSGTYHDVLISRMIDSAVTQSKTTPVLPGDVRVASNNKAIGGKNENKKPIAKPPAQSPNAPPTPMNSILSPATFDAPPQAYSIPAELPHFELPQVVPTDYAVQTGVPGTTHPNQTVGTGKLTTEPTVVVDNLNPSQQLSVDVAPMNWDPTSR